MKGVGGGASESHPKLQVTSVVVGSTFCSVAVNGFELPDPATAVREPGDIDMVAVSYAIVMVVLACRLEEKSAVAVMVAVGGTGMVGGAQ